MGTEARPREIRLTHRARLAVSPGRFVRCRAVLRPPPGPSIPGDYNFRRQAWFQGLHAVGYVQGRCRGGVLGAPEASSMSRHLAIAVKRRALAEYSMSVAGERAGGFAAALTSGDRSFMREEDRVALRRSGLAHLLAISGLHFSIVCGLVYAIMFRGLARIEWLAIRVPLQKPAAVAGLLAGIAYLVISGASVSTQRAFIMAALVFAAVLINRQAISLRTYAIAMVCIMVLRPDSVLSPGFQMSFAATGVLIAIYETWREHRMARPGGLGSKRAFAIKSLVVTSVAAGLATAPFAFYHFDRVAPFGLIANLLAMPIISLISAPAAALALILAPFGYADIGLRLFGWSLELVLAVAHWNDGLSTSTAPQWIPMPGPSLFMFSAGIAAFLLLKDRARKTITGTLVLAGFVSWWLATPASIYWAPSGDVYARSGGAYERIRFVDGAGLSPLSYKEFPVRGYCRNRRCLSDIDDGRVLFLAENELVDCDHLPSDVFVLSGKQQIKSCSNALAFPEIVAKGGAAIWLRRGKLHNIRFADACGARPWQAPCDP